MSIHGRTNLTWTPAVGSATCPIPDFWLDATDSSLASLKDTVGGAITNGATIGTWSSKTGNARDFVQRLALGRPTWETNAVNGLSAAHFVAASSQILTSTMNLADFHSMSGLTVMVAMKRNSANGLAFATTMLDSGTGLFDIVQAQLNMGTVYTGGGRRARGNTFDTAGPGAAIPANGIFIDTIAFGYANGRDTLYGNGVEQALNETFQTPGTTDAADPAFVSVGGFAQASGGGGAGFADGWIVEVLGWISEKTPDQLVEPHDYLCSKVGGGAM